MDQKKSRKTATIGGKPETGQNLSGKNISTKVTEFVTEFDDP